MAKVQLIGGGFQDLEGNVLASGYLILELSDDAQTPVPSQLGAGVKVKIMLDVNGDVFGTQVADTPKQYVWPNDQLLPANGFYAVSAYSSKGILAWGPQYVQVLSSPSPFNVGAWVPVSTSGTTSIVVTPTLKVNGTLNVIQNLLNLAQSGGVTITDAGNGTVTISALSPVSDIVIWYPSTTTTSQNLLHYNVRHGLSFGTNFAGSLATAQVAATVDTTINVRKNGATVVGTIVFAAGQTTGTLTCTTFTLASGDYLDFLVVAGDATLSGIGITLTATRTS